jgi:delta24-sterol reductase
MCSARPSWMSISMQTLGYKDTLYNVAIDLPDVLEIDAKNMVVKVEPSVTIGRFSLTIKGGETSFYILVPLFKIR